MGAVALFIAHSGGVAPVAIQIDGHAGGASTLVTLDQGTRWMLARAAVQAMDESHQSVITRVGLCHMVVQRFILAARRQLAAAHPQIELARRGVADTTALPSYPFRDDSLPLWIATRAFVEEYLALFLRARATPSSPPS